MSRRRRGGEDIAEMFPGRRPDEVLVFCDHAGTQKRRTARRKIALVRPFRIGDIPGADIRWLIPRQPQDLATRVNVSVQKLLADGPGSITYTFACDRCPARVPVKVEKLVSVLEGWAATELALTQLAAILNGSSGRPPGRHD